MEKTKRKILVSVVVIAFAVAAIAGGTFAWFTATGTVDNTFTAGTLAFTVSDAIFTGEGYYDFENVNPGDCFIKQITVNNTGTKYFLLRMQWSGTWGSGALDAGDVVTLDNNEGWTFYDGWWYYNGSFAAGTNAIPAGTVEVCFDGPTMDNDYQGQIYTLTINFQAIQASNNASGAEWGVNSVYDPLTPQTGANWISFAGI